MWMTTIQPSAARPERVHVTLVLADPAELEILAGLLGSKVEITRVPQAEPAAVPKESP
jgi:hypothetical protein